MLNLIPPMFRTWATIGLVLSIGALLTGVYGHIERQGYQRAARQYEAQIAEQVIANTKAVTNANNQLQLIQEVLAKRNQELHNVIDDIDRAAAADPLAGDLCLGPDSVRRLNSIN